MTSTPRVVALRIRVVSPPPGVRFRMQRGKAVLVPATSETTSEIEFDFDARLGPDRGDGGAPNLLGPCVQGRPGERFVYVNSGTYAGDANSCWSRRAKVPLGGITRALIEKARAKKRGGVLEARIRGRAGDGGPACASVPLLGGGWRVVAAGASR